MKSASVLVALSLVSLSFTANASDLPSKKSTPSLPVPVSYDWSGFYVGLHAGGSFQGGTLNLAQSGGDETLAYTPNPDLGGRGLNGGLLAGFNIQNGSIVYGLEADIGLTDAKSNVGSIKDLVEPIAYYADNELSQNVNGHIRARLGFASGPILFYGAAGLAMSDSKMDVVAYCFGDQYPTSGSANLVGYSVGAGAEYAMSKNMILRAEYLFDGYGHKSIDVGSGAPNYWQNRDIALDEQTVRVAISYKF